MQVELQGSPSLCTPTRKCRLVWSRREVTVNFTARCTVCQLRVPLGCDRLLGCGTLSGTECGHLSRGYLGTLNGCGSDLLGVPLRYFDSVRRQPSLETLRLFPDIQLRVLAPQLATYSLACRRGALSVRSSTSAHRREHSDTESDCNANRNMCREVAIHIQHGEERELADNERADERPQDTVAIVHGLSLQLQAISSWT